MLSVYSRAEWPRNKTLGSVRASLGICSSGFDLAVVSGQAKTFVASAPFHPQLCELI